MAAALRRCKDCDPKRPVRPAPFPGPRCATHNREFKRRQKKNNHEQMVGRVYGLPAGGYAELYKQQGGKCAICQRATGATKRLAVDHDHSTGKVRGLLCSVCNQFLGYLRDDPAAWYRGYRYLLNAALTDSSEDPFIDV